MSAFQGSKKKGRTGDAQVRRIGQRLQLMEAIVGKLLERENLALGIVKGGGLELVDRPAPAPTPPADDSMSIRTLEDDEPADVIDEVAPVPLELLEEIVANG